MTWKSTVDEQSELAEYSKFYLENVPRLVAFLVATGWTAPDAADCVQETMIAALPPVWATLDNPVGWCRLVAFRKACDLARRRREEPVPDPELSGDPLVTPDTELDTLEQQYQLLYWLNQLTGDKQRAVLSWTCDGATPTEIAFALNMNPATVRSTLRAARSTLRRLRGERANIDD